MHRGIPLNNFQKGQSVAYKSDGKGVRETARILHVRTIAVSNLF